MLEELHRKTLVPLLLFDLDGTIIDTNHNDLNTAKYKETKILLSEFLGIKTSSIPDFDRFYMCFNRIASNMSTKEASKFLFEEAKKEYGLSIDYETFFSRRIKLRIESYETIVDYINDGKTSNYKWLNSLDTKIKEKMFIISNIETEFFGLMSKNPNFKNDKTLESMFENRIITSNYVSKTKPSPEGYNLALEMSKPTPNRNGYVGIAFEDSISGIKAAKEARYEDKRLFVVGIESTLNSEALITAGVDITIPKLFLLDKRTLFLEAGF